MSEILTPAKPVPVPAAPAAKRPYTRKMKVFVVTDRDGNERLVRAYTSADALRHVTPTFHVAQADQDDIISLMAAGVAVETAGVPEQELPADEAAGLSD
jgi:hypothetical protein